MVSNKSFPRTVPQKQTQHSPALSLLRRDSRTRAMEVMLVPQRCAVVKEHQTQAQVAALRARHDPIKHMQNGRSHLMVTTRLRCADEACVEQRKQAEAATALLNSALVEQEHKENRVAATIEDRVSERVNTAVAELQAQLQAQLQASEDRHEARHRASEARLREVEARYRESEA